MERKDLFLNNDLSMMLSRESNLKADFGGEWEAEQEALRLAANDVIKAPANYIDAKDLMDRSARYADTEDFYQKLFVNGTDEEQLQELRSLEYTASLTLLPDAVLIAGGDLIDGENYAGWLELLYTLHFVPLQKAFCYCLTRHQDFLSVLNLLDVQRIAFPQTFLWSLLDHWFEWLTRAGGHLLTYEDEKGFYDKNEKAQELKSEAIVVKENWDRELPEMIHEIMARFSKYIQPCKLLSWATRGPLRDDARNNPYSANYNHCLELICADLSNGIELNTIPEEDSNLNMLLLMAGKAVNNNDVDFGKVVYDRLMVCLMKENFSGMEKMSELDEKRQRAIAQLVILVFPTLNYEESINRVATRFQGWNMDYQELYAEARREAYLICSLFRVFEVKTFENDARFALWVNLVDTYVWEYRRCENEYIMRDEFTVPFRVAVRVVENLRDEKCRNYLHDAIIDNVLSVVSFLTVFSECSIHLNDKTISRLLQRIDTEWPSAKMLMEVRGQRLLEARIENLIRQLRGAVKE